MAFQQYNVYDGLTAVRLASTSNIAGTYFNGITNNGVGATLTIAASSLTIDSVVCVVGDRVLLQTQTNTNEVGIYVVLSIGSVVVLQRAADMQNIEQIRAGQYVSVGAGSVQAGNIFTVIEPLPARFGIDALVFAADPSAAQVSFSGGPSVANSVPVFSDTAGNIAPQTTTATFPFGVTSAGPIQSTTGNITSGSSGDAGTFISFPATAANGTMIIAAANAGAAFNTTISNGTMGQSTVYTLPDVGAATGQIVVAPTQGRMKSVTAAVVAGGAASQVVTDAFCTAISTVVANWNTSANAVSIQKVTPGAGSFTVLSSGDPGASTLGYIIMKV